MKIIMKDRIGNLHFEIVESQLAINGQRVMYEVKTQVEGLDERSRMYREPHHVVAYITTLARYANTPGLAEKFSEWLKGEATDKGKSAFVVDIDHGAWVVEPENGTDFKLKEAQSLVDADIEVVYLDEEYIGIVDEVGRLNGKKRNFEADACIADMTGRVCELYGSVVICHTSMLR